MSRFFRGDWVCKSNFKVKDGVAVIDYKELLPSEKNEALVGMQNPTLCELIVQNVSCVETTTPSGGRVALDLIAVRQGTYRCAVSSQKIKGTEKGKKKDVEWHFTTWEPVLDDFF